MNITAIEIDGERYAIGTVGQGDNQCWACGLYDRCGHDGSLTTPIERLCRDNLEENECFYAE